MKVLFVCNTYYQLTVAIRMRLTIKKNDKVSVVLTDVSRNSKYICEKLQKSPIFDGAYYLETGEKEGKPTLTYLKEGIRGIIPEGMKKDLFYDELIGFNYDIPTCALYASLEKANKAISCNVMEEGLLSYSTEDSDCKIARLIRFSRRLHLRKNAREKRKFFYCFNPRAYKGPLKAIQIPPITADDAVFRKVLFDIFLDGEAPNMYRQKYIYLSSVYDFEGGASVGEIDVALKLSELVGTDNLIVKPHPRDSVERIKAVGLTVADNSSVPWEVFQIGCDFSGKVLISSFSGAIINLNSVIENRGRNIYTNKLCDISGNPLAQHFSSMIDEYLSKTEELGLKNISAVSSIEEII